MPSIQSGQVIAELGENDLLNWLLERHQDWMQPAPTGPGDDCALISPSRHPQLLKTDALVEGIHWEPNSTAPQLVGRKALARALSDIAAMGGSPKEALLTLCLPPETPLNWLDQCYQGMKTLAQAQRVQLAGGELSSLPAGTPKQLVVMLRGEVAHRALHRDSAQVGDYLAVTGQLGNSFHSHWHLRFEPRLRQGRWLAQQAAVHAAMDLSDGLAADLPRLARASKLGYQICPETLPLRTGASPEQALNEGEDYELLLAVAAAGWDELHQNWQREFPDLPLSKIGLCVPEEETQNLEGGFQHFQALSPKTRHDSP